MYFFYVDCYCWGWLCATSTTRDRWKKRFGWDYSGS